MAEFSNIVFSDWNPARRTLVEASAGTGKTYNIQNAYLRLALEMDLTVQQILVVTFTEAATRELRDRLRRVLVDARHALQHQAAPADSRIAHAIAKARENPANDDSTLLRRIQRALMDFDGAAIFTIHGFCNRVLERYAFECGHDPDAEFLPDQARLLRETCQDWWRNHAYPEKSADGFPFDDLDSLFSLVQQAAQHPDAIVLGSVLEPGPEFKTLLDLCSNAWKLLGNLRGHAQWIGNRQLRPSAKADPVDVQPLSAHVAPHSHFFEQWRKKHPETSPEPNETFSTALSFVVQQAMAFPASGDANSFRACLKTVALQAEAQYRLQARAAAAQTIAGQFRDLIRDRSTLTYDAMLFNVRKVLRDSASGPRLKEVLRREFRAALIDEFQDTDPIQFGIFDEIFSDPSPDVPSTPLLFVGDPKQAIYGFRSGDLFTYFKAREDVPEHQRHSLETNFRSEQPLVDAVNELFKDDQPGSTFLVGSPIAYPGTLKAQGTPAEKTLLTDGTPDPQPLKVWTYAAEGSVAAHSPLSRRIASDVAREIARLLASGSLRFSGQEPRPVRPSDIAVLVRTHAEAAEIQGELLQCSVNAVRQATGSVFDSDEAAHLALVMKAMLSPGRASTLRSALSAPFIPCPEIDLAFFNQNDLASEEPPLSSGETASSPHVPSRSLEEWIELFRNAGLLWQKQSFIMAFQSLSRDLGIRAFMAGQPDGIRSLSSLHHLVELAHQTARTRQLGPVALLRWFTGQLDPSGRDDDEATRVRLADDNSAVQIMTIFKSKGLQFPIVFLPTLWRLEAKAMNVRDAVLKYHDSRQRLVLDLDTKSGAGKRIAKLEHLQENIRLAYVGLTRAINRIVAVEVAHNDIQPESHALAHLLARWLARNPALSRIEVFNPPPSGNLLPAKQPDSSENWPAPLAPPAVDKSHGRASFSSLTPHVAARQAESSADVADRDQAADESNLPAEVPAKMDPLLSIPGGAKLGTCWHKIFELLDFQASDDAIAAIVDDTLDLHHVCKRPAGDMPEEKKTRLTLQRQAIHHMVRRVIHTDLDAGCGAFQLRNIPMSSRRSELEFNFSLHRDGLRRLGEMAPILDEWWTTPSRDPVFIRELQNKETQIPLGFMTGSIDLAFEHGGRFYIVDWKSNQLDRTPTGFDAKGLAAEMRAHAYYLQYLIYSTALHGFLARHLAAYDYDRHFGGVFYLFLRGMGLAEQKTNRGIFGDRPSKALIERLSIFLGGAT